MKTLLIIAFACILSFECTAQPQMLWQKCLGGSSLESVKSILEIKDGGYLITGTSTSNDGNVSGNHGSEDVWMVKISAAQSLIWQRCLGGSAYDDGLFTQQTKDGNFIVCGATTSNDGDVSGNHGLWDIWVIKIDGSGAILWQQCLGGNGDDFAWHIQETNDGGYIVAGTSTSNDGNVSGNHGNTDAWLVKLTSSGTIEWQKCLGGSDDDYAYHVLEIASGGYLVVGGTVSNDGDVSGNHGGLDLWVIRLNENGQILWQKCSGGSDDEIGYDVQFTPDGGFITAARAVSNDGDVSGNHGGSDYWIVKCDGSGNIQWQSCLGGSLNDKAYGIVTLTDNNYIVTGFSRSSDDDVSGNHGGQDIWVVKLNINGSIIWQKCLGGSTDDIAWDIIQSGDGGFLLAANTNSTDGDVIGNHGDLDYWIVKLQGTASIGEEIQMPYFNLSPVPANDYVNINFREVQLNMTASVLSINGATIIPDFPINMEVERMDIGSLSPGIYFLRVSAADKGTMYRKFIVLK